jgi:predicted glycosyltransferase
MKILYAVQKTGNGHLARAQEIIPILEKYGDVTVLTSGSQSQIQLGFPVALDFKGISLFYGSNGNVSFLKTLFNNKRLRTHFSLGLQI